METRRIACTLTQCPDGMHKSHAQRCAEAEIDEILTMQREGQRAALTPHVPLQSTAVALAQTQEVFLG